MVLSSGLLGGQRLHSPWAQHRGEGSHSPSTCLTETVLTRTQRAAPAGAPRVTGALLRCSALTTRALFPPAKGAATGPPLRAMSEHVHVKPT